MTQIEKSSSDKPVIEEEDFEAYEDAFLEKVKTEYKDGWSEGKYFLISFYCYN